MSAISINVFKQKFTFWPVIAACEVKLTSTDFQINCNCNFLAFSFHKFCFIFLLLSPFFIDPQPLLSLLCILHLWLAFADLSFPRADCFILPFGLL